MSRLIAVALAVFLTTAALSAAALGGAAAVTESTQHESNETAAESNGYAGTYVAFETSGDAVTEYAVDGEEQFERVTVQSQSEHRADANADASVDLEAVANLSGVALDLEGESETRADVETEGSATITVHDTERGILTVDAGGEDQYVEIALADESEAETDGEVVVVENENRTGAFVVVGDGEVTVNDEGTVTADLGSESTLVFRSYAEGERDEEARQQEELIAEGTATAEVYVDERDGERVVDVVTYGEDVAVEAAAESEERVEMTVDRAHGEGTIVVATVSEAALETAGGVEDLAVAVDGEAAAEASSKGELEGAAGGDESAYAIHQTSEGSADVLVAVDHASERAVAIGCQESDDESAADGENDEAGDADETDDGDASDDDADDASDETDDDDEDDGASTGTKLGLGATLTTLLTAAALRFY